MRTITYNAYTFDELSDEAKAKAIIAAREKERYWDMETLVSEAVDTIKAAADEFNCRIWDWSIGPDVQDSRIKCEPKFLEDQYISGNRLRTYIINHFHHIFYTRKVYWVEQQGLSAFEQMTSPKVVRKSKLLFERTCCPLTGVCYDETFIDVFRAFVKKPYDCTFAELFGFAVTAVCKDLRSEEEYQQSDEGITEYLLSNDVEFTENGELL